MEGAVRCGLSEQAASGGGSGCLPGSLSRVKCEIGLCPPHGAMLC